MFLVVNEGSCSLRVNESLVFEGATIDEAQVPMSRVENSGASVLAGSCFTLEGATSDDAQV